GGRSGANLERHAGAGRAARRRQQAHLPAHVRGSVADAGVARRAVVDIGAGEAGGGGPGGGAIGVAGVGAARDEVAGVASATGAGAGHRGVAAGRGATGAEPRRGASGDLDVDVAALAGQAVAVDVAEPVAACRAAQAAVARLARVHSG